jgi:hypothetical protein
VEKRSAHVGPRVIVDQRAANRELGAPSVVKENSETRERGPRRRRRVSGSDE